MNPQYNAPPGWHLWDDKMPAIKSNFYFLLLNENGDPELHLCTWCYDFEDLNDIDKLNPIIWQYSPDFEHNLLALTKLPAKTLQYMDGNPQTLANLALQVFEDGVKLGYDEFCPYENNMIFLHDPRSRKLMLKKYFDL